MTPRATARRLWRCPKCRQTFVTKNLWHSCCQLTIDEFFRDHQHLKPLYRDYLKFMRRIGPITVNVNKTRISFQRRVRFAGVAALTKDALVCGFWLKRRIDDPRLKVEFLPPDNYVYRFKLANRAELDDQVRRWMVEAYAVGEQREQAASASHVTRKPSPDQACDG